MKMLQEECEQLSDWFIKTYPMGELHIHVGINTKDNFEEYNLEMKLAGKQWHTELRVPPGWQDQDIAYVTEIKKLFLERQQKMIKQAAATVGFIG